MQVKIATWLAFQFRSNDRCLMGRRHFHQPAMWIKPQFLSPFIHGSLYFIFPDVVRRCSGHGLCCTTWQELFHSLRVHCWCQWCLCSPPCPLPSFKVQIQKQMAWFLLFPLFQWVSCKNYFYRCKKLFFFSLIFINDKSALEFPPSPLKRRKKHSQLEANVQQEGCEPEQCYWILSYPKVEVEALPHL